VLFTISDHYHFSRRLRVRAKNGQAMSRRRSPSSDTVGKLERILVSREILLWLVAPFTVGKFKSAFGGQVNHAERPIDIWA
jgi:hypothetical protein